MTQAQAKDAIDHAFLDSLGRMFGVLVADLETQKLEDAKREFRAGFECHLRALEVAQTIAQELIKD